MLTTKTLTKTISFAVALGIGQMTVPASAQEFEFRLDVNSVETQPTSILLGEFADRVNEMSEGRIEITPFYGGSLGIEAADQLRALRQGSVEMASLYAGYFARDAPDLAMALVQGVITDPQQNLDVQPTVQEIYGEFYADWDVQVVGWTLDNTFEIAVMCSDDPVNTLDALRSKKLRVWSGDQVAAFERLGVAAQIIPQNELYIALQTGVVDCALYGIGVAETISLQEVTDYASALHFISVLPSAIGIAQRDWDELPEDLQAIVLEAGQWTYEKSTALVFDTSMEDTARDSFAESGALEVLEPFPAEDRDAFFQAVSEVWETDAAEIGRNAPAYHERVVEALEASRRSE